jgi:hypothetical protein
MYQVMPTALDARAQRSKATGARHAGLARALFLGACLGLSSACQASATTNPDEPPPPQYVAKIVIEDMTPDAQERLEQHLQDKGYTGVDISQEKGSTILVFETDRGIAEVERDLARVEQPQLKVIRRGYVVEYAAVDNIPPEIKVIYPEEDGSTVVTEQPIAVAVEVEAEDTERVVMAGTEAERVGTSKVYRANVDLKEGENVIHVQAVDEMGNTGEAEAVVTLDTTAPQIAARVKIIIEGDVEAGSTVLINGVKVNVDENGHYEHEIKIHKGQKQIEIVAIDENGNKTESIKELSL